LYFTVMTYGQGDLRPRQVSCASCPWHEDVAGSRSDIRPVVEAHRRGAHPDATIGEGFLAWLDSNSG
jgi:hypothetical protein